MIYVHYVYFFLFLFAVVYTIEFQKRGLPHAHIVLFLTRGDKYPNADAIDRIISAEIPDPDTDPELHTIVSELMMHGPCGQMNPACVCMQNGTCTKHFPKRFVDSTTIDDDGYPVYQRRNDGRTVEKNEHYLDNRYLIYSFTC